MWLMLLTSCANKSLPKRNFEVTLYKLEWKERCIKSGTRDKVKKECLNDPDFPLLIGITPEDYVKEREFQDDLKASCQ